MIVETKVSGIIIDPISNSPVLILKEISGTRVLPIWIGVMEAAAIAAELENVKFPRPMTHDLIKSIIEKMQCILTKVIITELKENTYYANIYLEPEGGAEMVIDSRPSDAVAIALRTGSPIFVSEEVLEKSRSTELFSAIEDEEEREKVRKKWEEILASLSPEDFGKYKM